MVREGLAWRITVASPTTTASSYLTGQRHGCWKHQGSTGLQRKWKVRQKKYKYKTRERVLKALYPVVLSVIIEILKETEKFRSVHLHTIYFHSKRDGSAI